MEVVQGENKEPVKVKEISEKEQGFKFSYEAFSKEKMPFFWQALQKVYTCKSFPGFKSAYRIKRLCEAVQAELKNFQQLMKEVSETTDAEAQEAKMKELCELQVDIKWNPLTPAEIEAIPGLSPADIDGLTYIADPSCFQ